MIPWIIKSTAAMHQTFDVLLHL